MKASSAMRVERAVAKALSERIVECTSFDDARADLATLRAIHARTPSEALPLAIARLVRLLDDDDPKRVGLVEEGTLALEQARALTSQQSSDAAARQFMVPPQAYTEVPSIEVELALDPKPDWHLPPPFAGDWADLDATAASAAVNRVRAAFPRPWGEGVIEGVRAVRRMVMSCYRGFDAVEVLFRFGDRAPISQVALLGPQVAFWVTGVSNGLHQLNAMQAEDGRPHLDISDERRAMEYLRFFCSSVHGDEGPFRIVEDITTFNAHMQEGSRYDISPDAFQFEGLTRVEDESDETAWLTEVPVLYSNAFFRSSFKIKRSGMVEMVEDEAIAADLPAIQQIMLRGLRQVRAK